VELDPVGGDGPTPKQATFIQALYLPKNSQGVGCIIRGRHYLF